MVPARGRGPQARPRFRGARMRPQAWVRRRRVRGEERFAPRTKSPGGRFRATNAPSQSEAPRQSRPVYWIIQPVKQPCGCARKRMRRRRVQGREGGHVVSVRCFSQRCLPFGRRALPFGPAHARRFWAATRAGGGHGPHRDTGWPQRLAALPSATVAAAVQAGSPFGDPGCAGKCVIPARAVRRRPAPVVDVRNVSAGAGTGKLGRDFVERKGG